MLRDKAHDVLLHFQMHAIFVLVLLFLKCYHRVDKLQHVYAVNEGVFVFYCTMLSNHSQSTKLNPAYAYECTLSFGILHQLLNN